MDGGDEVDLDGAILTAKVAAKYGATQGGKDGKGGMAHGESQVAKSDAVDGGDEVDLDGSRAARAKAKAGDASGASNFELAAALKKVGLRKLLKSLAEKGVSMIDGFAGRFSDWLETELKLSNFDVRKPRFVAGQTLPAAAPAKAPSSSGFDGEAPSETMI